MLKKSSRTSWILGGLFAIQAVYLLSCASTPKSPPPKPTGQADEAVQPSASPSATPAPNDQAAAPAASQPMMDLATLAAAQGLERRLLSESIRSGLTGMSLEPVTVQAHLLREAHALLAMKAGHLPSSERRARMHACLADEPGDSYAAELCRLTLKIAGVAPRSSKVRVQKDRAKAAMVRRIVRALSSGHVEGLAEATEGQVFEALKKLPNISTLRPATEKALDKSSCAPTAILTGLGMKAEENFPDPEYKSLSKALYGRALDCGSDSASTKAGYRLGLIQVWDGQYDQAQGSFARILGQPDISDYRSRVLYWAQYCAKQRGDSGTAERMRAILVKEHPMSLHGLLMAGLDPGAGTSLVGQASGIVLRSKLKPGLNAAVAVAEALQVVDAREMSVTALVPILEQLRSAEPEFQLYVGLLLTRAGDSLNKFKLLSGLFRENPGLIAHESLEMLFPLQRFEIVQNYEAQADPYLVISLIRQESAFNERARSRVGAMGLMQLMPRTARRMERVSRRALFDPKTNIRLGVRFFSHLTERYSGDVELALAAYNAGPDKVDAWKERYPIENRLLFLDLIPYRETREYVASIARNYFYYKKLYATESHVPGRNLEEAQQTRVPTGAGAAPEKGWPFKFF